MEPIKKNQKLTGLLHDASLLTQLENLLSRSEPKKGKTNPSLEEQRETYEYLQEVSEKLADQEMENVFEKEGSLREPPLKVTRIKEDPCLSEKSSIYPLLQEIERTNPEVAQTIARRVNSIIIGAAIGSRSQSENQVYRKKIGRNYQEAKNNMRSSGVDLFDTELMAFDLHRFSRFIENQGLERDGSVDPEKLKAQNDALFGVIKGHQDYVVADCEFEADLLKNTQVTFAPAKDPVQGYLADVFLQDPRKVEGILKPEALSGHPEFSRLPERTRRILQDLMTEQAEGPKNRMIKIPTIMMPLLESLMERLMPGVKLDVRHLKRLAHATLQEEPPEFLLSIDAGGELVSQDGSLDNNALKLALGTNKYESLRAEILTKMAALLCSKQSLEAGFNEVTEQTFKVKLQTEKKGKSPTKKTSNSAPQNLPRIFRLYRRMIDTAETRPEVMPEVGKKERHIIAHRRLLPPGLLPSKKAVEEAKKNQYPTSPYPGEIMKRPETKRLRTKEGIGKLYAVQWMEGADDELIAYRMDADQIDKKAKESQKDINDFIDEVIRDHEGAHLRFYTYVAEPEPQHIQGQTRGWFSEFMQKIGLRSS